MGNSLQNALAMSPRQTKHGTVQLVLLSGNVKKSSNSGSVTMIPWIYSTTDCRTMPDTVGDESKITCDGQGPVQQRMCACKGASPAATPVGMGSPQDFKACAKDLNF